MDDKIPWMVKEQTLALADLNLIIRFGSNNAHTVHLQIGEAVDGGKGATIVFQRGGEVIRIIPHAASGDPLVAPPVEPPPEPYQPNPHARVIGNKPGAEGAAPGTTIEPAPVPAAVLAREEEAPPVPQMVAQARESRRAAEADGYGTTSAMLPEVPMPWLDGK